MSSTPFIPYHSPSYDEATSLARSLEYEAFMNTRRSLRHFSDRPVAPQVIASIVRTASTAPSGAHKQPWMFCLVNSPEVKRQIREAAEQEEYENYHGRMSEEWLADLEVFNTDWHKPFLEIAPWLIVVFKKAFDYAPDGARSKNYYVNESVGIATGFLLAAIHQAGLVALTHTPSPMNFLQKVLERPDNERPFLLIPVGYPAEDAQVPQLSRKPLEDIAQYY